jgi:hypothetical protein
MIIQERTESTCYRPSSPKPYHVVRCALLSMTPPSSIGTDIRVARRRRQQTTLGQRVRHHATLLFLSGYWMRMHYSVAPRFVVGRLDCANEKIHITRLVWGLVWSHLFVLTSSLILMSVASSDHGESQNDKLIPRTGTENFELSVAELLAPDIRHSDFRLHYYFEFEFEILTFGGKRNYLFVDTRQ